MRLWRTASAWVDQLTATALLSLVPAFATGLVALVAAAPYGPAATSRVVLAAFVITLGGVAAVFMKKPATEQLTHHDPAGEDSPKKGITPILVVVAVAISFLITYPKLSGIGQLILGNTGDSGLNIYLLEWQVHAAANDPGSYFDPNIFSPEKFTLMWGPSLIPLVPFYALGKLATGNPIAAFNLLMVASTFATLLATFVFARTAGFGRLAGALGALLYATTGQRIAHLSHLDSVQTLWIPILGTMLLKSWEKNRIRHGVLLGVTLGLSLLAAPYYFLSGLALAGTMVLITLPSWRSIPWRALAAGAGTMLAIGAPILMLSRVAGLSRSPEELFPMNWADYYHPGAWVPAMRWLASAATQSGGGRTLENWLFPSIGLTVLGALGAVGWLRARREGRCPLPGGHPKALVPLLAAAGITGIVMSAGPYLELRGHRIPLPMLLVIKLPGFDSARVTGRFVAPAFLALSVVAMVGAETLASRVRSFPKSALFAVIATAVLVTTQSFSPATALDVSGPPTAVNRQLAKRAEGLVVELPWAGCPGYGCLFTEPPRMIWSRFDWFPRMGGYSGHIPGYWLEAQESLASFPDPRSMQFLNRFGVRYLILRVNAGANGAHFAADLADAVAGRARTYPGVQGVEKIGEDYLVTLR